MKIDHERSNLNDGVGKIVNQQRRQFSKLVSVSPAIISLFSTTALGQTPYNCAISGIQSGNTSNPDHIILPCDGPGTGFSPGAWWQNAKKINGSPDGKLSEWLDCGVNPFTISLVSGVKTVTVNNVDNQGGVWNSIYDAIEAVFGADSPATPFNLIFQGSGPSESLHDVFYFHQGGGGTLEFHAAADYLNAKLNEVSPGTFSIYSGISSIDIINLYKLAIGDITEFLSASGTVIMLSANFTVDDIKAYLVSIHHS